MIQISEPHTFNLALFLCGFCNRKSDELPVLYLRVSSTIKAHRACSHEPGTVNYPGVMIAPGQALPRVHMMICCPWATLPRVNFIAPGQLHCPGQVHRHLITTNLSEFI